MAAYPILTLALSGRAAFSPLRLTGMLVAVSGVGLVVRSAGAHSLWGDAFLIAGGLAWAAYNILARRDGSGASPIVVLSLSEVDRWRVPSGPDALRIAFLAGLCSVAAFLLYNHGLRRLEASVAVNLLNIVPVAGLGWAVLLAGERLTLVQLLGGAVVIAGVTLGARRKPATASTPSHRIGNRRFRRGTAA